MFFFSAVITSNCWPSYIYIFMCLTEFCVPGLITYAYFSVIRYHFPLGNDHIMSEGLPPREVVEMMCVGTNRQSGGGGRADLVNRPPGDLRVIS